MEIDEKGLRELSCKHKRVQTLMHYVNKKSLIEEHRKQCSRKAVGVDSITKEAYGAHLDANISNLLERMKSFSYQPKPVRRTYIPKGNGKTRPLGIPSYEDKLVQGVMAKVLNDVYEPRFLDLSYGFRPNRSCHDVIKGINDTIYYNPIGWIVEADIKGYFDSIDHDWLMKFLEHDIQDKNFLRYIVRFLKAGILEEGKFIDSERGSPQGGLISPVLANVYLHYVLDVWFEKGVKPHMRGQVHLYRYADDFLVLFQYEDDAKKFYAVLPKRLEKFNLELAPEKTRIIPFGRYSGSRETFDFLGFTHINGKTQKGYYCVMRRTSEKKLKAKRRAVKEWMRVHMHYPIVDTLKKLSTKLVGHYRYYGISGNIKSLSKFYFYCMRTMFATLRRRGHKKRINWQTFNRMLKSIGVATPKIYVNIW